MDIGPVPVIQKSLESVGLTLEDMDQIEINEAFAAQYLVFEKALNLDRNKTNLNGRAFSLGHPFGCFRES